MEAKRKKDREREKERVRKRQRERECVTKTLFRQALAASIFFL